MKILVVCGAGASSTFVALRLRRSATLRGLTASVTAITEADLLVRLAAAVAHTPVDVVLVGPHLAPAFPAIAQQCAEHGALARLLPTTIFTDRDGETALDLILAAMGQPEQPSQTTTTREVLK
ncbi:PTS sugar transporter [Cryobacterium sp. TMT1-3]|uniref:PTS sugar transporter n=1 Tax=Cryobacterium luteum TaxID=1424661 RepID=A0A1H8C4J7_9MICO|nr:MULTISPECIES: hypothetical protein [Cryobacterium]TFB89246.1 PTS sugar transporter [Cryobacterium luteum]TFC27444.1 PTS sugar transporter [Cryobacterium sp. TMT1-3]SEM89990.1 PTS system, cellobiose-specific IIB component [Cryobacterium luteum]